jgi:hypothetical protein
MWALYRSFPNESIARIRYLIVIARLASKLTVNGPSVALCSDLLFAMFSVIRLLATLVVLTLISTPLFSAPRFTEFMASNNKTLLDEDDDASDWIEIFNPDLTPIDPGGYYLTDDAANLTKWQFPSPTSLNSPTFLVVFASDKNRTVSGSQLHTNFKLSADGEYLALVIPDAIWTDSGLILHSEEHNGDGTITLTYRSANPVEILPDDGFFRVVAEQR